MTRKITKYWTYLTNLQLQILPKPIYSTTTITLAA